MQNTKSEALITRFRFTAANDFQTEKLRCFLKLSQTPRQRCLLPKCSFMTPTMNYGPQNRKYEIESVQDGALYRFAFDFREVE
jgi:hypothetical protein